MSAYVASLFLLATSPPADLVRQSLAAHSEWMFRWLVLSSIITGIGVIFEAPGELHELARWRKLKRLKKPVGWKVPVTFFGLVLVIGGIIAEGVFEYLSSNAETAIRAHDEDVLGDTIIQAGEAKDSAEKARIAANGAVEDAKQAGIAAGIATKSSGVAIEKASAVSATAAKAEKSATGALALAGDAKAQVATVQSSIIAVDAKYAPRTLSKIKRDILMEFLTKAAAQKPKQPIVIWFDSSAPDGAEYGKEIGDAINEPTTGWKASKPEETLGDGDKTGVFLVVRDLNSPPRGALELQKALMSAGIGGSGMADPRLPAGDETIRIVICKKN